MRTKIAPWVPVLVVLIFTETSLAQTYSITDLGTLGGPVSVAWKVNDNGDVVGDSATADGRYHAFLWTSAKGMQDLGAVLGPGDSFAFGVNDLGEIAGEARNTSNTFSVRWTKNGKVINLGALSEAFAINRSGMIVGEELVSYGVAYLWTKAEGMQELGMLTGGIASAAHDINDIGQVTGSSGTADHSSHAFLWTSQAGMQDLGSLGGSSRDSVGNAINGLGQVAGQTTSSGGWQHPFLWTQDGGMEDLGVLGGSFPWGEATGINDSGQVVGNTTLSDGTSDGFLWTRAGGMHDLKTLLPAGSGWTQVFARSINASGQIVGNGSRNGMAHAFLMTPAK